MELKHSVPIEDLLNALSETVPTSSLLFAKQSADIALTISKERIRRNMSQASFAEFLAVSQSKVAEWERDTYNFTIEELSSIAYKLGLGLNITLEETTKI